MNNKKFISAARDVINLEIKALRSLKKSINKSFSEAVFEIANCQSKVILCGVGKKRLLIPMPLPIAQISARFFEIMPKPLLTRDQLKLLKYDNVLSGKYKSNSDIGVPSLRYFDDEVKKYCYMWREGGQFSTEKYNSDNIDINTS